MDDNSMDSTAPLFQQLWYLKYKAQFTVMLMSIKTFSEK